MIHWKQPIARAIRNSPGRSDTFAGKLEQWMRDTEDFVLDEDRRTRFEAEIGAYRGPQD